MSIIYSICQCRFLLLVSFKNLYLRNNVHMQSDGPYAFWFMRAKSLMRLYNWAVECSFKWLNRRSVREVLS